MLKSANHFHGSDLEKIQRLYGMKKEEIVSFSANVNPLGLSQNFLRELAGRLDVIAAYPDREYGALRQAAADYCGVQKEHIIVGNGSTELISLIIRHKKPGQAVILGPTYSEYEREVTLAGGRCRYFPLRETDDFILDEEALLQLLPNGADMLILCNPNNPTSSVVPSGRMRRILNVCKRHNILVMVDETYVEFVRDYDRVTCVPLTQDFDNLVVLRGVSKFFAAPGLRLGYAVTGAAELACTVAEKQNPWTVSSVADAAGQLLWKDQTFIQQTRTLINAERERICQVLSQTEGIKIYPPHANFILVRLLKENQTADGLFDLAVRRGMMIRSCSSFPFLDHTYFRFCFMLPADNDRLLACIREFTGQTP